MWALNQHRLMLDNTLQKQKSIPLQLSQASLAYIVSSMTTGSIGSMKTHYVALREKPTNTSIKCYVDKEPIYHDEVSPNSFNYHYYSSYSISLIACKAASCHPNSICVHLQNTFPSVLLGILIVEPSIV